MPMFCFNLHWFEPKIKTKVKFRIIAERQQLWSLAHHVTGEEK